MTDGMKQNERCQEICNDENYDVHMPITKI
jgi:hypothetical protein